MTPTERDDDKAEREAFERVAANLDKGDPLARIGHDIRVEEAKLAMFDELTNLLHGIRLGMELWPVEVKHSIALTLDIIRPTIDRARKLQRGEL